MKNWLMRYVLRDEAKPDGNDAGGGDGDTTVLDGNTPPADCGGDANKTPPADGDKGGTPPPAADWRKDIAGDDPDAMKTLQRFASPKAMYESYKQIRDKQAKGELKAVTAFPEKGTEVEKAAWFEANGIPKDPSGYDIKAVAESPLMTEDDRAQLEKFAAHAHAKHLSKDTVGKVLEWFTANRAEQQAAAKASFEEKKTEVAAELGAEWGAEYKGNINRIDGLLDATIPADQDNLKALIRNAIASNAHFARHYEQLARQINPSGANMPLDGGGTQINVEKELTRLDGLMRTDRKSYNKQEKYYGQLLQQYQQMTGKNWNSPT
jgi:hypothetical protein